MVTLLDEQVAEGQLGKGGLIHRYVLLGGKRPMGRLSVLYSSQPKLGYSHSQDPKAAKCQNQKRSLRPTRQGLKVWISRSASSPSKNSSR